MEKFEYKVVTYDTKGFWGGTVETRQIEEKLNLLPMADHPDHQEMGGISRVRDPFGQTQALFHGDRHGTRMQGALLRKQDTPAETVFRL